MKQSSKKGVAKKVEKFEQRGNKVTKIVHESTKEIKVDRALVDNFIALQKVMVNLSTKFDNLSLQISKLLELFEISAKSLARKDIESSQSNSSAIETKKVLDKLDNLTQQAGLIGKGLALIHEINSERTMPLQLTQSVPFRMPQQNTQIERKNPLVGQGIQKPMPKTVEMDE